MGTNSNKALGTAFEEELARMLYERGFWVHLLRQTEAGQPADIIACRDGKPFLIDCKVCSDGSFLLSRIEENQELAMKEFFRRGNDTGWFALQVDGDTFFFPLYYFLRLKTHEIKRIPEATIRKAGYTLDEWVREVTG